VVEAGTDGVVTQIDTVQHTDLRINAGFFLFKQEIFDYMRAGEELVLQPFQRLIARQQLITYRYDGFWASIDTFKEKKMFDDYFARGDMPWVVWDATSKYYRAPMDNRL
jgi:glucose-1-phosphate cytidylyltransferase